MGAFHYVTPRMLTATRELNGDERIPRFVGRQVSAAPATGMGKIHMEENKNILDGVFGSQDTA